MRRFLSLFTLLMLTSVLAFAQTRVVSGRVTDADGKGVPNVSIVLKNGKTGIQTDLSGFFQIKVKDGDVLVFSHTIYNQVEIPVSSTSSYNITLQQKPNTIAEVVVTGAYGRKTTARSASTNVQAISGEKLNTVRAASLNDALAGKFSGIQVRSQSSGKLGASGNVRIRGEQNTGGSSVLYVLDGTRVNPDDVNMDEVDEVNFLQGPSASAIYGPDGANGAFILTSKKAIKNVKGVGIELNMGVQFENVSKMPNYQNSYAGGDGYDMKKFTYLPGVHPAGWAALDGKYYPDYTEDVSWGPRMVGQEYIPWYAWYEGHERSFKTARLTPNPNNARDFYQTAVNLNNGVTFNNSNDFVNYRITYNNRHTKGILPNSDLNRNTINAITTYNLSSKLTLGLNLNYYTQAVNGDFNDDYANATTGSFNQWFHRDLDMGILKELKDLTTPQGIVASWNHQGPNSYDPASVKNNNFYGAYYWYNPYKWQELNTNISKRNKMFGDISLTYKLTNDFSLTGRVRKVSINESNEFKVASELEESQVKTGVKAGYSTGTRQENDQDVELIGNYTKKVKNFSITAMGGLDIHEYRVKSSFASTNDGLNAPNVFSIGNSKATPTVNDGRYLEKDNGIFLTSTFGYKNMLFAEGTLRNDWLSVFPKTDNAILAKSFGGSFVFSELTKESVPFLSYGKIRASYGETPQSFGNGKRINGAYQYPGSLYGFNTQNYGSNPLQFATTTLVDPKIKGAVASMNEVGLELGFLKNRIELKGTYWKAVNKNFPSNKAITGTSGITSILTNVGEIDKEGVDLQATLVPIRGKNFAWTINATYSYLLNNKIVDLDGDPTTLEAGVNIEGLWGTTGPYLRQIEGQQWGMMFGNGKKRDANGTPLLDANGFFVNQNNVKFGNVLPKYTGGVQNSFNILKNFNLNVNIDYQFGGKFFSLSDMWGSYTGLMAQTAVLNDKGKPVRDPVADGGGVHVFGVDQTTLKPVNYYVDARQYYTNLYSNKTFDDFIYDMTFVKMREISFGYNIPVKDLNIGKKITRANLSVLVKNPWLIYAKTKDFDPAEISDLSGEAGNYPATRTIGLNLKIGF